MSKHRFWCLTLFGTDDRKLPEAVADLLEDKVDEKSVTYAIAGYEYCPETGRKHAHIYAEFKNPRAMAGVKTWLGWNNAHCEPRQEKESNKSSILYCKGFEKMGANDAKELEVEAHPGYKLKDVERGENVWHEEGLINIFFIT